MKDLKDLPELVIVIITIVGVIVGIHTLGLLLKWADTLAQWLSP